MEFLEELPTIAGIKYGLFLCPSCGEDVKMRYHNGLKNKQCYDCYQKSKKGTGNPNFRHGQTTNGYTPLYWVWSDMKRRATRENHPRAKRYFLRGIDICEEWLSFEVFHDWAIKNGYREGLTLDRVNNNKGYYPSNCRWTSNAENTRNSAQAKLTHNKVREIKAKLNEGTSQALLARDFAVSERAIYDIKISRTWREI